MKSWGSCNSRDSGCLDFSGKVFYYLGPVSFFFSFFFLIENICLLFHTNTVCCDYIHIP